MRAERFDRSRRHAPRVGQLGQSRLRSLSAVVPALGRRQEQAQLLQLRSIATVLPSLCYSFPGVVSSQNSRDTAKAVHVRSQHHSLSIKPVLGTGCADSGKVSSSSSSPEITAALETLVSATS